MMPAQIQFGDHVSSISARAMPIFGERLRILHVVSCLGMGGTEHGVLKVIRGLGEDQFEHRICGVRGVDADFAKRMNAPRAYSASSSRQGFQFPLFRLARIMKEFRPHIVHTRNFGSLEAIPAARIARVPVAIHSEHGYELDILKGLPLRRRLLCRAFYTMADTVFAVTEDLRTYHARQSWLPANRFRVIYNGVDLEKFRPLERLAPELHRTYGIPEKRVVIGSVGRLVPIKDHATLLQAAEILLGEGKDLHVLLVGDGPESARLKGIVASSSTLTGRVTFAGPSGRVPELLSAMNVFVLPSICEGMSNTLLEAMSSGLPVVATRAGGNPELVDDGESGWLFAPRDVDGLASALRKLIDDASLRLEFGRAARERAADRFGLAGMMQRYRDLYFELAVHCGLRKRN